MDKSEIIEFYMEQDILIGPELLPLLEEKYLPLKTKFLVFSPDVLDMLNGKSPLVAEDFEKAIVLKEKNKSTKLYDRFMDLLKASAQGSSSFEEEDLKTKKDFIDRIISEKPLVEESSIKKADKDQDKDITTELSSSSPEKLRERIKEEKEAFMKKSRIRITSSYTSKARKWFVHDFVNLYNSRFKDIEKILRARQELQSLTSIARITQKKERENVAFIGAVYDKGLTKTGNIMLTLEDPTGMIKAIVNKSKEELFRLAEEVQLDEVIGITGMFDQIVFINSILIPDIPLTKELKKSPEEGYFIVIADTEPGSKLFLEKEFNKFLSWLNGELGNEKQREVASKVKYIFIAGDLVAGVGIYPNQEYDLNIIDIYDQYKALAELLRKVPIDIPIFVCPGNHDVGRMSEPQPPLTEEYAGPVISLPNVISLSNPSTVNIYAQPEAGFEGFDVMTYHGLSFIYYSEHIPVIRRLGGQKRPDLIMKYLLQRRHLAPSHTSTLYIPDPRKDPLLIDKIPDFFVSGHVHRAMVSNYKNVTCINASCWTAQSDEQERRGLEAQPAKSVHSRHAYQRSQDNELPFKRGSRQGVALEESATGYSNNLLIK